MPETPESPKELPPAEVTAASAVTIASAHECETPQTAHVPKPTKENAPMLDVHPAHHPAHSWRDFFVHIATNYTSLKKTSTRKVSATCTSRSTTFAAPSSAAKST